MYRLHSYRRKKSRKKLVLFILLVLIIVAAKTHDIGFSPNSAIAEKSNITADADVTQTPAEELIVDDELHTPAIETEIASPTSVRKVAFRTSGLRTAGKITGKKSELNEVYNDPEFMISTKLAPGKVVEDRQKLNDILHAEETTDSQREYLKKQLSRFSEKWLFSRNVFEGDGLCSLYKVAPGDVLTSIAKKYDIPYGIIMRLNSIKSPKSLRAGNAIKVVNGPFNCKINRSGFTMDLYLQDTFVKTFPIGLGMPDMETPTGNWVVKPGGKMISPTWTDPDSGRTYSPDDSDYPLGTRWIGIDGVSGQAKGRTGFAIHGSNNPKEIGSAVSRGCIRMHNSDVELIYDLLKPGKSKIMITD